MKMKINGIELEKHPSVVNPLHELVNRMDTTMLKYVPVSQKLMWIKEMTDLYTECGQPNNTLERTVKYLKYLKDTKSKKAFELEVEKIFWNYILRENGLSEHLKPY